MNFGFSLIFYDNLIVVFLLCKDFRSENNFVIKLMEQPVAF